MNVNNIKSYYHYNHRQMRLKYIGKCIGIYIGSYIIINPLTTLFYVTKVGYIVGLSLDDECGHITNMKTQKRLRRDAQKIKFIHDLAETGPFPWLLFHPLAMPYSCYHIIKCSFSAIHYSLYYKARVEMGEFDE